MYFVGKFSHNICLGFSRMKAHMSWAWTWREFYHRMRFTQGRLFFLIKPVRNDFIGSQINRKEKLNVGVWDDTMNMGLLLPFGMDTLAQMLVVINGFVRTKPFITTSIWARVSIPKGKSNPMFIVSSHTPTLSFSLRLIWEPMKSFRTGLIRKKSRPWVNLILW